MWELFSALPSAEEMANVRGGPQKLLGFPDDPFSCVCVGFCFVFVFALVPVRMVLHEQTC